MKAGLSDLPSKALIFCHTGEKDGWLLIRRKIEVFFKKEKKNHRIDEAETMCYVCWNIIRHKTHLQMK